ncbi:MAG: S9 family peptidase [Pirellulales bacterium]
MPNRHPSHLWTRRNVAAWIVLGFLPAIAPAQDRLKEMPGYEQFQKMSPKIGASVKRGALSVTWIDGGKAIEYRKDGKLYRYDIAARKAVEIAAPTAAPPAPERKARRQGRRRSETPARGRQYTSAVSPDGRRNAFCRNRNLWLSDADGANERAVTADGNGINRIKYGTATWVYGEELDQRTAMWWSPDSKRIAFYRIDESRVPDFFLQYNQTQVQDTLDVEPFVKAGGTNPVVDLWIYDLESGQTTQVDVRDGKPFDDAVVGHYVYNVRWSPDGKELLFHRMNRRQNVMELAAADPASGKCRVVVREEWPATWTEQNPAMQFLNDGKRFIWTSERTGFKNFYLYELGGKLLATLTSHECEVADIVRVDEASGVLYYMAHSGDNPMKLQLHRVGLDGQGDRRLTDAAYYHSVDLAPDCKHFVDVAQTHNAPPATRLLDSAGVLVDELASSDMSEFVRLGLKPVELLKFKAADGQTDLYGLLHFPSTFDAEKKYPLLVSVYAGPATCGARETFTMPSALTEYGFLVASFDSRSASGRGKRFLDAIYRKFGQVEMDDQAAGVKSLWNRPYLNRDRVGIFGTSYGGTASATCLVRFPDVFRAACSSSPVTDYRNYDSIYTERYMGTPQDNKQGYDAASIMTYVPNLKGRLMLFYGTADNNVHPSNSMQLIQALQRAGKSFELQVGPDRGHESMNQERMMEFFIENLAASR